MSYHVGDHVEYRFDTILGTTTGSGQILTIEEGMAVIDSGVLQMVDVEDITGEVHPEAVMD